MSNISPIRSDQDSTPLGMTADSSLGTRALTMARSFTGLMPASIGEAVDLASRFAKSQVVPKALRNDENSIFVVIMAGIELGLSPIRAIQNITVISGNLTLKADLMLALVRRSGLLADYAEGFATMGVVETIPEDFRPDVLAKAAALPNGTVYGWAVAQRQGDARRHCIVFSKLDADRVEVPEYDGPNKRMVKLSEKDTYRQWGPDMYPKRARGRLLQMLFPDALAGIPPTEAYDEGQVIDAEFTREVREGGVTKALNASLQSVDDGIATTIAKIRETKPEVADGIERAFDEFSFAKGRRLQKLKEYDGRPEALLEWMRTEYAKRNGRERVSAGAPATAQTVPATKAPAPAKPEPPAAETAASEEDEIDALSRSIFGQERGPNPASGRDPQASF